MAKERQNPIVDFNMAAFADSEVAIVFGYDAPRSVTPRAPIERIYAMHRAYNNYTEVERHQIKCGDERLRKLGVACLEHFMCAQNREWASRRLGARGLSWADELVGA